MLVWACTERMEENRIPKRVLYMNLGTTRLRGRPRNRWHDEVGEVEEQMVEKGGRKMYTTERLEERPESSKESSHSAQANGMNDY